MRVIEIEDQGQDFTELHVDDDNVITDAQPFQGDIWRGFRIYERPIRVGMILHLTGGQFVNVPLRYPVIGVRRARA